MQNCFSGCFKTWDVDDSRTECSAVPWFVEGNVTGCRFNDLQPYDNAYYERAKLTQTWWFNISPNGEWIHFIILFFGSLLKRGLKSLFIKSYTFTVQMCHFLEMKVLPAYRRVVYMETGPNLLKLFIHDHRSRACQIPQPITCSCFSFAVHVLWFHESGPNSESECLCIEFPSGDLSGDFFCLADMQCNTALAEHWSVTEFSFLTLWIQIQTDMAKSKAVFISVYRFSLWP